MPTITSHKHAKKHLHTPVKRTSSTATTDPNSSLQREKVESLVSIWGPKALSRSAAPAGSRAAATAAELNDALERASNSSLDSLLEGTNEKKQKKAKKDSKATKSAKGKVHRHGDPLAPFRLHCFVGPKATKNDVRRVFDAYGPNVEVRSTQKGNALNRTFFAIVSFRNMAMGLHAVQTLNLTDQSDFLDVSRLELSLMLSREEQKIVRRRRAKLSAKD